MGLFNQFPFTNFHEMNLDWLITSVKELKENNINIPEYLDNWLSDNKSTIASVLTAPAYVNVKDFGAKGDGVTDDHIAIVSAINSAKNNGGILYFPTGTYINTSVIEIPEKMHITGDGSKNSIIKHTGTCFRFLSSPPNVPAIDTVYSNLCLEGDGTGYGFEMVNVSSYCFQNMRFEKQDVGVYATGGNQIGFINCSFVVQKSKCLWLGAKDARVYIEHIDGVYIIGCSFGEAPIDIQNDGSTSTATLSIIGCQFYGYDITQTCIWLDRTHGVSIINSWFELSDKVTAIVLSNRTAEGVQNNGNTTLSFINSYVGSKSKICIDVRDGTKVNTIGAIFINPAEYAIKTVDYTGISTTGTYYEGIAPFCNAGASPWYCSELSPTKDTTPPTGGDVTFSNTLTAVKNMYVYLTFTCTINGTKTITPPQLFTAFAEPNMKGNGWNYGNGVMDITGNGTEKTYEIIVPTKAKV